MKKVYIIEDDDFLRGLIIRKLSASGFEIKGAGNWQDAQIEFTKFEPQALVLDLMLPLGMDGFGILEHLRSKPEYKSLPIIVFSNMADSVSEKRAVSLGANAYMVKSNFTLDELVDKINEIAK
jgi:DNA-binding response OmpR family regulator